MGAAACFIFGEGGRAAALAMRGAGGQWLVCGPYPVRVQFLQSPLNKHWLCGAVTNRNGNQNNQLRAVRGDNNRKKGKVLFFNTKQNKGCAEP